MSNITFIFLLLFLSTILHQQDAVASVPTEVHKDFRKSGQIPRMEPINLQQGQACPCGKQQNMLDTMAVAYFTVEMPIFRRSGFKRVVKRFLVDREEMGKGNFGKVFHATRINFDVHRNESTLGECVAIKIPNIENNNSYKIREKLIIQEANVMQKFHNSRHIIRFIESLHFESTSLMELTAIEMEIGKSNLRDYWYDKMELMKKINQELTEMRVLQLIKQILLGLEEMHQQKYIHLDLKPHNVVVVGKPKPNKIGFNNAYLKLIDVGGAVKIDNGKTEKQIRGAVTTLLYEAPEVTAGRTSNKEYNVSTKTDIYSLGILILKLLSKTKEFITNYEKMKIEKVLNAKVKHPDIRTDEFALLKIAQNVLVEPKENGIKKRILRKFNRELRMLKAFVKKLDKKFPRILKLLKDCLIFEPKERLDASSLLEKHFKDVDLSKIYNGHKQSVISTSADQISPNFSNSSPNTTGFSENSNNTEQSYDFSHGSSESHSELNSLPEIPKFGKNQFIRSKDPKSGPLNGGIPLAKLQQSRVVYPVEKQREVTVIG